MTDIWRRLPDINSFKIEKKCNQFQVHDKISVTYSERHNDECLKSEVAYLCALL